MKACVWVLVFSCCFSEWLWAQEGSSGQSTSPPEASATCSPELSPSWSTLDGLLTELERSALDLNETLASLYRRLSESETRAHELSTLLAQSESSLKDCAASLAKAQAEVRRLEHELVLWRIIAGVGLAGCVGLLVWTLGK